MIPEPRSTVPNLSREVKKRGVFHDISGQQFGRFTAVSRADDDVSPTGYHFTMWLCRCDCGSEKIVNAQNLKRGLSKSCGCLRDELAKTRCVVHGHNRCDGSRTRTHTAWGSMIARCTNPKTKNYHRYGGRGISVCERWRHSYINFLSDMGEKPKGLTLHRSDNDGNYEPKNCVWASRKTQARNRSTNHHITMNGVTLTLVEWSEISSIPLHTIIGRLRLGWKDEDAITRPVQRQ